MLMMSESKSKNISKILPAIYGLRQNMAKKAFKYLVFYIGLVCFLKVSGQNPALNGLFTLKLINTDSVKVFKYIKYKDKYKTKKDLVRSVNGILDDLRFQGYLL